jgi:hypothetical protein
LLHDKNPPGVEAPRLANVPQSRRAGCRGFDSPVGEEVSPLRADRLKVERAVGSPNGPPGRCSPACSGLALLAAGAGGTAPPPDYAAVALNVLPPGESGDLRFPPTASDQPPLYDGLTPHATVTARDLTRYFKSERFGVTGKVVRVERPRPGVRILRDRWDAPHVYGKTRADVEFGTGYATVEDRSAFMEQLGGPAGSLRTTGAIGGSAFSARR